MIKHLSFTSAVIMTLVLFLKNLLPSSTMDHGSIFINVSNNAMTKIRYSTFGNPTWVDFDNNGHLDIFVINHGESPSLFRNNGDGTFTNIRPRSGIPPTGDRHGAAWGDYDNDGNVDLFITTGANRGLTIGMKTDQLYRNNGNGFFTDVTTFANVSNSAGRGRSVNWVDFNNDGYLDLFVKNTMTPNVLYRNNGDGTFTDVASSAGIADAPGQVSSWADYDNDGNMDLFITGYTQDQLWRNNGDGTFTEVTSIAGLKNSRNGQGVAWGDYNNDGNMDLYIARGHADMADSLTWDDSVVYFSDLETAHEDGLDFSISGDEVTFDLYFSNCRQPIYVFIGSSDTSPVTIPFTITSSQAVGKPSYITGRDVGFFIWYENNTWKIRWNADERLRYFYGKIETDGEFITVEPLDLKRSVLSTSSTLYMNNGDGTFTNVTLISGVDSHKNNRGAVWGDYNMMDIWICM